MAEASVNGARIYYEEYGSGPTVVLVHGLGGNATYTWKKITAPLAEEFHVVAYDLRGSGRSEVTPGPYSIEQLADDLAALLDAVGLERVGVIGHSLGGGIGLRCAATHPDRIAAVVGVGAVAELSEQAQANMKVRGDTVEAEGMADVAVAVATMGLAPSFREANPDQFQEYVTLLAANVPAGYAAQCRALSAMRAPYLESIQAPVLLVAGELDQSSPPAMNHANAARIPNARVVEIAGCAHIIPWEKPAELLAAASPFLKEHL
jgi:3-oxoadipate enol-lactonase